MHKSFLKLLPRDIFDSAEFADGLSGKAKYSSIASISTQGIRFALKLGHLVILARLLRPSDFGIVAMAAVTISFATIFRDMGLGTATIQKKEITHQEISNLFWINVAVACALGGGLSLASPCISRFFGRAELVSAIRFLSIAFVLGGVSVQHLALLRRHLCFGGLAIVRIGSELLALVVAIVLAVYGWGFWSLVAGQIALALATACIGFAICPWLPSRPSRNVELKGLLRFGAHLTAFDLLNYFARNVDDILIGRYIGTQALGLYSKAYGFALMPISLIRNPLQQVALPILASVKEDRERFASLFLCFMDATAILTVAVSFYCLLEADFLIGWLMGDQWRESVPVFRIFAFIGLFQPTASLASYIWVALGRTALNLKWGAISSALTVVSFVIGIKHGIWGVALAYGIGRLFLAPTLVFLAFRHIPLSVTAFFRAVLLTLALSLVASGIALAGTCFMPDCLTKHLVWGLLYFVSYALIVRRSSMACRTLEVLSGEGQAALR